MPLGSVKVAALGAWMACRGGYLRSLGEKAPPGVAGAGAGPLARPAGAGGGVGRRDGVPRRILEVLGRESAARGGGRGGGSPATSGGGRRGRGRPARSRDAPRLRMGGGRQQENAGKGSHCGPPVWRSCGLGGASDWPGVTEYTVVRPVDWKTVV